MDEAIWRLQDGGVAEFRARKPCVYISVVRPSLALVHRQCNSYGVAFVVGRIEHQSNIATVQDSSLYGCIIVREQCGCRCAPCDSIIT